MKLLCTNNIFDYKIKSRFWEKVESRQADQCWIWDAAVTKSGYGWFDTNIEKSAHRISWIMHFGYIPKGLMVLHKCDVKRCINPNHLYLGDTTDNNLDRYKRQPNSGRGRNYSKLTLKEAKRVISLCSQGYSFTAVGRMFDVTGSTIGNIFKGKTTLFKEDRQ